MAELKLIAFDVDDLAVLSAHLQDAVLKVGDIAYLPRERRFAAIGNRFDWADALKGGNERVAGIHAPARGLALRAGARRPAAGHRYRAGRTP